MALETQSGTSGSAGAVAAVLKDALLEEGTKLADVVFGEVGVAVGSQRRAGGGEHHPEQVPQVALQQNNRRDRSKPGPGDRFGFSVELQRRRYLQVIAALGHHALVTISKKFLWRELESRELGRENKYQEFS